MERVPVKIKKLHPAAIIPQYQTNGAACFDFCACEEVTLEPGDVKAVKLGIAVAVPPGYEMQCRPRSGLALKKITVENSPGTIDCDYRGELRTILHNESSLLPFVIKVGDRIAQGCVKPVYQACFEEVTELDSTDRGEGGFGSTGVN